MLKQSMIVRVGNFAVVLVLLSFTLRGSYAQVGDAPVPISTFPPSPAISPTLIPTLSPSPIPTRVPQPEFKAPVVPPPVYREPAPKVFGPHSEEQLYNEGVLASRLGKYSEEIHNMRAESNRLPKGKGNKLRNALRTASGNLAVANTKLKQLRMCDPKEWEFFKKGLDASIDELETAVDAARQKVPKKTR